MARILALVLALVASASALSHGFATRRELFKGLAGAAAVAAPAAAVATYTGLPFEELPKSAPKEKWNTLYPEKKLTLDKKSPVDRFDLSPPTFQTYKKTYPGLTTAFGNK